MIRSAIFRGLGLVSALAVASLATAQAGPPRHAKSVAAPETPQQALLKVCGGCHNTEIVTDTPKSYEGWRDTMQDMIDRGAKGTPDEYDLILQYLYENMTTVDVNHADADTLATVLDAPPDAVQAIIARRQTRPFKDLADLTSSVPGLDAPALEAKKRMIFFSP
jgi:competence protein ComEA